MNDVVKKVAEREKSFYVESLSFNVVMKNYRLAIFSLGKNAVMSHIKDINTDVEGEFFLRSTQTRRNRTEPHIYKFYG